ncbi:MAG: GNAT family N-acetyltransferase, partial [Pseudoclavibacter sp.]
MTDFPPSRRLSPADLPRLRELADRCRAEDGLTPFNDQTLALIGQRRAEGMMVPGDDGHDGLDAAAVHADGVWEIAVAPAARRRGLGRRLLNAARRHAPAPCWAHGDHPAARRLAAAHRLEAQRTLHRMTRPGIS